MCSSNYHVINMRFKATNQRLFFEMIHRTLALTKLILKKKLSVPTMKTLRYHKLIPHESEKNK